MRVRKIEFDKELKGDVLAEIKKVADVPKDAQVFVTYWQNGKFGVLVQSAEYGFLEAGDLVYYAPAIPLKPAPEAPKEGR